MSKSIKVAYCVGITSGSSHQFIEEEGSLQCSSRPNIICYFCSGSHANPLDKGIDTSSILCFFCYRGDNNDDEVMDELKM